MKRTLSSVAALAVAAVATGSLLLAGAGAASAATAPPWEPDVSSVGGLSFFNAAGHAVTSGSINTSPVAAFVEGNTSVESGDSKATLFGFLPKAGSKPTAWSGAELSASSAYPNAAAPSPLGTATLPVVTGSSTDFSIADLIANYPNKGTGSYANVYQLRLLTSAPQKGFSTQYDSADILITGTTWSEIYPNAGTPTAIKLMVSKTSITFGGAVKLTATVTPKTAAGSVIFFDAKTTLKKVTVSGGKAVLTTKALSGGSQKVTATFAPTATSGLAASVSGAHTVKVKEHSTKVTVKGSVAKGKKVTLTIKVSPKIAGKVTVLHGKKKIGTAKVKAGKARFVTSKLKAASYQLTVRFTATKKADYATSTSKAVTVRVTE